MTVAELISVLEEHDPSLRVVVDGYEGGYDDLSAEQVERIPLCLDVGRSAWEGRHDRPDLIVGGAPKDAETTRAVALHRRSH